jgi:MoaA/NifB/PqqE/SkfB family radical SAM enzyme
VETLKAAAPKGGRQVHVMTVLMAENRNDLERQLERSRDAGVGHMLTLLSKNGYRRADGVDEWPDPGVGAELRSLYARFPHFRVFTRYLDGIDAFLEKRDDLPGCQAGERSFNVDHVGNVSPCIEKIDRPVGNVRTEPLAAILGRLKGLDEVARCQQCWTLCRGFNQAFAGGGSLASWRELGSRVRA